MKNDWLYLTSEDLLAIHEYLLGRFGGMPGLRDEGLFQAALEQPKQTFGGEDLYPDAASKAARYAFGIINNHPFADGNKRTGAAGLGMFLQLNGAKFKPRHAELLETVYAVADGSMDFETFVEWVRKQLGE